MKEQENNFEDRLRKILPSQEEKYPLPENYFSDFKSRLMDKIEEDPIFTKPVSRIRLNWWVLPTAMAACMALFALVKPTNNQVEPSAPEIQLAEVEIFEEMDSPLEALDSSLLEKASELELVKNIQVEIELDELYEEAYLEPNDDYIATLSDLESEDLEDYLIDNLNLNTEL